MLPGEAGVRSCPFGRPRPPTVPDSAAIDAHQPARHRGAVTREHSSFAEFWPYYLREHSRPRTRALHYAGTSLAVALAIFAVASGRWLFLAMIPAAGYLFAWIGHFVVEKNRPATFTYPLWSLVADFRMWGLWLTGRLGRELKRAGVAELRGSQDR